MTFEQLIANGWNPCDAYNCIAHPDWSWRMCPCAHTWFGAKGSTCAECEAEEQRTERLYQLFEM